MFLQWCKVWLLLEMLLTLFLKSVPDALESSHRFIYVMRCEEERGEFSIPGAADLAKFAVLCCKSYVLIYPTGQNRGASPCCCIPASRGCCSESPLPSACPVLSSTCVSQRAGGFVSHAKGSTTHCWAHTDCSRSSLLCHIPAPGTEMGAWSPHCEQMRVS